MKKNVLLIFIIILLLIITFNTTSYCSDNSLNIGQYDVILPEWFLEHDYFLLYFDVNMVNGGIYLWSADSPFYLTKELSSYRIQCSDSTFYEYQTAASISSYLDGNIIDLSEFDYIQPSVRDIDINTAKYTYFTNHNILYNSEVIIPEYNFPSSFRNPSFLNTDEELQTGKFENIKISNGDFDIYNGHYYLHTAYVDTSLAPGTSYYINEKVFILDSECSYKYTGTDSSILHFIVPKSKLGFTLENGKKYIFVLSSSANSLSNITTDQIFDKKEFTVSGLTTDDNIQDNQDIMNDKLDEQTNAIKENTETNKGIWETIKDILSYINPFSENFFVYKLIELLVEAIKSLFIPSDDFLGTYFTDLKEWFSDRLGFLFYPFELVIDILNMILDIDFSEPVFNIPDITEPFSNKKLISATTFKFNDLLENNTFNTIHSIYLVCVDVFVVFGLVNLFRKKYEEVTTK